MRIGVLCVCALAGGVVAGELEYQPMEPEIVLADGSSFLSWSDRTDYSRTLHVNQNHPEASDENEGTADRPFRTINRAAEVVRPGERVWIHAGVYREQVRPRRGGEGPDRMIAYEAAPGEPVVIRGSRVLEGGWSRSRDPHGRRQYSRKLWMATLPEALFEEDYFPFRIPNASDEEIDLMPWALEWKGRIPYTLPRGLIFQDGRRMTQLATYEDLVRLSGSYWVAPDGQTVHIHPFGGGDPNGQLFEVAVQSHIFRPQSPGLGFIRVNDLTLEHCANGFPRIGVGALFTMGGHHWIIENNTVRHVNSVGIEIGWDTFERADHRNHPPREDADLGRTIVRGNRIYDCGTAGIRSFTVSHALIEQNDITDCGWHDVEYYWETAGIKLLITTGTVVRNNRVGRITGGTGIWLDWANRNSRVTGNVIHDVSTVQGAVFIEASQVPNLVDHNVIWNIDGRGIRAGDTDNLLVAHNLIGRTTGAVVEARKISTRSLGGREVTGTDNRVVNNIFFDAGRPIVFDEGNVAAQNVYVSSGAGMASMRDDEEQSVALRGEIRWDESSLLLEWPDAPALELVEAVLPQRRDFFGRERAEARTTPGPFSGRPHPPAVRLDRDPRRIGGQAAAGGGK